MYDTDESTIYFGVENLDRWLRLVVCDRELLAVEDQGEHWRVNLLTLEYLIGVSFGRHAAPEEPDDFDFSTHLSAKLFLGNHDLGSRWGVALWWPTGTFWFSRMARSAETLRPPRFYGIDRIGGTWDLMWGWTPEHRREG